MTFGRNFFKPETIELLLPSFSNRGIARSLWYEKSKSFSHKMLSNLPKFESEDCWNSEMTNWRSVSFCCCHAIWKQPMGANNWKRDELLSRELFLVFYCFLIWASFVLRHLAIVKQRNWNSPKLKWVERETWVQRKTSNSRVRCHDNLDVVFKVYQRWVKKKITKRITKKII